MELLLIVLLLLMVVVLWRSSGLQERRLGLLQDTLNDVLKETRQLRNELRQRPATPEVKPAPKPEAPAPRAVPAPPVTAVAPTPRRVEGKEVPPPVHRPMAVVQDSRWQQWMKNNPDLEKFIGENLANKIGIAVLVLGIAFFVKYAIDRNWINEAGRVSIGLLCGALLTGLAHYLRRSYHAFSSVLAGGGLAVFYFTIAFAFHQYQLLSQTLAFLLMVLITGFAVGLSLLYDRVELAVIAAVGGFLTPFLVSTGEGNYVVLFSYLLILNAGLLALAFFKRWPLINVLALLFTQLIYGGWLLSVWWDDAPRLSYPLALLFAVLLYLQFVGMNTVYQLRHRRPFRVFDFSLLLWLNAAFFAAGMTLLSRVDAGRYQGLFTVGIGALNLFLARYFFRRQGAQKLLVFLLIGLTLTFLSLAVPVQLKGNAITLFWSAEFVLLFWLYRRSRIPLLCLASLLVAVLATGSLLMDWAQAAGRSTSVLVLIYTDARGLVTSIVAALAFFLYGRLALKETAPLPYGLQKKPLAQGALLAAAVIGYLTIVYGVNLAFYHEKSYAVPNVYHRLVAELVVAGLFAWTWRAARKTRRRAPAALIVYLVYHLCSYPWVEALRDGYAGRGFAAVHLAVHFVTVLLVPVLVAAALRLIRPAEGETRSFNRLYAVGSGLLLLFFSQEAHHVYVLAQWGRLNPGAIEDQYYKAVLTIVWALFSFGWMWLGMRYKQKTVRVISLAVFTLALLKLFFYDMSEVSEGGKIVAFILLGVLLLTISFMYQRLKKMIIDDTKE